MVLPHPSVLCVPGCAGCWLLAHHHRARIPQSISQPRRAHAPMGHPVPPSPIGHNQTQRHSRAKRRSSRLIQTQMVSDRGSLQGQRVTLPAGNQDTAFQVCFKYSSPHAHPGLSFRDQSSSFWKQHVCLQSATGAQTRNLLLLLHPRPHLLAGFVPHMRSGLDHHFWEETSLWLNCLNTSVGIQSQPGSALGWIWPVGCFWSDPESPLPL